eukprot:g9681.t1
MAARGDAVQAARETARLGVSTVVEGVATGIIEVGAATPVVAPLCVALLKVKGVVDGVSRNKEELEEMHKWCRLITEQVIVKAKASSTSTIDVSPLQKCVDELNKVAKRHRDRGRLARFVHSRNDGEDIQRLRVSIQTVVPIMGLAAVVDLSAHQQPPLAPVPRGVPMGQSWYAVRDGVVGRVCQVLGGDGGPVVAALTGRSGAGKTTCAATMVGERGPIRPRLGETEDEARTRLDSVRALFPDGVVWLRVGKGAGTADRLPSLMLTLAQAVFENVMGKRVAPPAVGENGERYVKKILTQKNSRCLVVADDVWESSVVEKLRETGMWVLLTTRIAEEVLQPVDERVVVDQLTSEEAEEVLRGAAKLPPGERLCDHAMKVLEICGYVAMDIAFVGSWSSVRTADSGVVKSNEAWADAVKHIMSQISAVSAQISVANAGAVDDVGVNRLAVLRAGFKYLGAEDVVAQELYMALGVFPNGHAFKESDAAVLLYDEESLTDHQLQVATGTIAILERWAVLRAHPSGLYRMHDAHVDFARGKLMSREDIKEAELLGGNDLQVAVTLQGLGRCVREAGRPGEAEALFRRALQINEAELGAGDPQVAVTLHELGRCVREAGRPGEAEALFRQALQINEAELGAGDPQVAVTLYWLGFCVREAGRPGEAEALFRRALQIEEAELGPGDRQVAVTLYWLGLCVREAGRPGEAEALFRRALQIEEAELGPGDPQVTVTLYWLGFCVREAGRPGEAEALFRRALQIEEAELGAGDPQVAVTLHELGRCVREAGRPGEAEALFRRALQIKEAELGGGDVQVAVTLHELGRCVREAGRPGEAEALFRRALQIKEAELGPGDVQVAITLCGLCVCVCQAGRPGEAEALVRRALQIMEAELGPDDRQVAFALHELGLCVREAGRPGEAEALFRRALQIKETELGADHPQVALTLHELGRACP